MMGTCTVGSRGPGTGSDRSKSQSGLDEGATNEPGEETAPHSALQDSKTVKVIIHRIFQLS
jgi:hypothetical protein